MKSTYLFAIGFGVARLRCVMHHNFDLSFGEH